MTLSLRLSALRVFAQRSNHGSIGFITKPPVSGLHPLPRRAGEGLTQCRPEPCSISFRPAHHCSNCHQPIRCNTGRPVGFVANVCVDKPVSRMILPVTEPTAEGVVA